ncbi:uncharacterized protein FOMMEDRAFT_48005, partial [Fomitiporia mediterranea MF3/22]|uniref:uncharacterized protein n=1 Tax=Fomitiporia mediterranea (strain MF3/22) TaxID=694068 RepID=UPI00044096C9
HAQWYSNTVPAMIPIALLGSAVYIGLQLVRTKLATEKYLDEANARIAQLEEEIKRLQSEQEEEARRTRNSEYAGGKKKRKEPSRWWW